MLSWVIRANAFLLRLSADMGSVINLCDHLCDAMQLRVVFNIERRLNMVYREIHKADYAFRIRVVYLKSH